MQRTSADFVKVLLEDDKTLCMVCVVSVMKENILFVFQRSFKYLSFPTRRTFMKNCLAVEHLGLALSLLILYMYDGIQIMKYILSRLSYNIILIKRILSTNPSNLIAKRVKIDIF